MGFLFQRVDVLCIGEVLFDVLGDGQEIPGGAPANVAFHAAALGAASALISRVGNDERGARLRQWLESAGIGIRNLQEDAAEQTGVVRVDSPADGPRYDIAAPAAWDFIEATDTALDAARSARVVVFGTLAQRHPRAREAIRRLVREAGTAGAVVLCDLNLRSPFFDEDIVLWSLRHCDVLKLNREELEGTSGILGARGETVALFRGLLREFGIPRGVLTCGADGAWLCEDGETRHVPAAPAQVADTVGAGDAFCAMAAASLSAGRSLREAAPWCAEVSAAVVTRPGATPPLPGELAARARQFLRGKV